MGKVFGIDLGTTYSCIAYIDEYGRPVVLKNSDGEHTTPSVVMVESADNIIVGTEAKRSIEIEPDKTVQFIKRKMGREQDLVHLNGLDYHAPEISSMILKKIVGDANSELQQTGVLAAGEEIRDVVITCPAYFGMNEREATKTAGTLAGLNVIDIINEPTAAAISYGVSGNDKNETVLVYDLGGGTFDITVMNISGNNITVVCTGGDDQLGGKDWDEALMDYVTARYEEETGEDLTEDPDAVAALYVDVETWKKALTSREKVNISVNGPAGRFREELTRENYEEITKDLLNRTKNLLDDVLLTAKKSGYPLEKIDKVLLVGGSSRMPQVSAMIVRDYHVTPVLADPDEAVAKGAALYAANQNGMSAGTPGMLASKLNITNVLSRTYGIESLYGRELKISNLLMINQPLPASVTKEYETVVDNQAAVEIKVFESRSTEEIIEIDTKEPIAVADLKFSQAVPKATGVLVTLELDHSGCLHIVAEEEKYHSKLDTTFQLSNQMDALAMREASMRMAVANVE